MPRFRYSASATVDGSGSASIRIAPSAKNWVIEYLTVRCSSKVLESLVSLYENQIGADYLIDTSFSGSSGDTTDTRIVVPDGYCIWIVWTGADIGGTVTATFTGDET